MKLYPLLKRTNTLSFILIEAATIVGLAGLKEWIKPILNAPCQRKVAHQITLRVRLKNEMFYGCSWADATVDQFIKQLNIYIKWYAEKRIKLSLGGMSPLDY